MSSHREAPAISKDPVADNTDLYAFVSPDRPDTVTIIANYLPLEAPPGGPNFYEFGDDVLYEIKISNDADADPDITYQFKFSTAVRNGETFLYNTGPISSLTDAHWNRPQTYSVTRITEHGDDEGTTTSGLRCPPCNIGPSSTPNYANLAAAAVGTLRTGERVFAGQRAEGFYVDLGAIFDLGDLRPLNNLHLASMVPPTNGVNATKTASVHTIALQIPKVMLTRDGSMPSSVNDPRSVIGVWAKASRRKVTVLHEGAEDPNTQAGPWVQISRLAMPLVNEVIIPMGDKDGWNKQPPRNEGNFLKYYQHPELARLLPVLYPGQFPHLAALSAVRDDIVAIFLTGIPGGVIPGFQNATGGPLADLLRLNMAVPPTTSNPSPLGIPGGDLAGFPNGRRVFDDIVTIELRALAGLTYGLLHSSYQVDAAVGAVTQGLGPNSVGSPYLSSFPYLGVPLDGYHTPSA